MHLLYNLSIYLLIIGIRIASIFNPKAKKWVAGRRDWRTRLEQALTKAPGGKTLWVHVSSLGEFEQGRPVIEQFRGDFPDWRIVLTFFSPSGYEIRKDYPLADVICYLPADTLANARDFIEMVHSDAAVFVKYDFWANYLLGLKKRNTPTLLVSALFRPSQPFFSWYGGLWREMLTCFTHIFVQNTDSEKLLQKIGFQEVTIAGDTRVDRVLRIAAEVKSNPLVEAFKGNAPVFVAGSTWEADERLCFPVLQSTEFQHYKVIVAPHEPSERNVSRICAQFSDAVRYTQCTAETAAKARVLVIDNIGLLNTLYKYGTIAYIGGGLGKGIHNTLEPAAFGLPIIFGPKYEKFEEARQFVRRGGAYPVGNQEAFLSILQKLQAPEFHQQASAAVSGYLEESKGATEMAIAWLRARFPAT